MRIPSFGICAIITVEKRTARFLMEPGRSFPIVSIVADWAKLSAKVFPQMRKNRDKGRGIRDKKNNCGLVQNLRGIIPGLQKKETWGIQFGVVR